jgi:CAAX prenyl protease-like protein
MLPYVLPFVLYLALTQLPGYYPDYYPQLYAAVVVVVGATTLWLLRSRGIVRPHFRVLTGVNVGVAGIVLWIALCRLNLEQTLAEFLPSFLRPSQRAGFNPFEKIASPLGCWAFIAIRLLGLAVLVPVVEELFWRGFLLRWLISADWQKVNLGQFSTLSFCGVTLLFTLVHPEWVAAAVYCALLNGLLYWKRDLWICIVAHGMSNLLLGIYIMTTGAWELW